MRRSAAPVAGFFHARTGLRRLPTDLDRSLLLLARGRLLRSILGRHFGQGAALVGAMAECLAAVAGQGSAADAERCECEGGAGGWLPCERHR